MTGLIPGQAAVHAGASSGTSGGFLSGTSDLFSIVSVLILVGGVVAAIWAARTRRSAIEIQNYKELAESYEKVSVAQKAQIEELQASRAADEQKIRELQAKLDALTDIVTGKSALDELARQTQQGFADLRGDLRAGRDEVIARLDKITQER